MKKASKKTPIDYNNNPCSVDNWIDFEALRKNCSNIDLEENSHLMRFCKSDPRVNFLFDFTSAPDLTNIVEGDQVAIDKTIDYIFHSNTDITLESDSDLHREEYKPYTLAVVGQVLLVGIHEGFGKVVSSRIRESIFLTDCLEMCRSSMQNPMLTASPLYRRFVFSNVNA